MVQLIKSVLKAVKATQDVPISASLSLSALFSSSIVLMQVKANDHWQQPEHCCIFMDIHSALVWWNTFFFFYYSRRTPNKGERAPDFFFTWEYL